MFEYFHQHFFSSIHVSLGFAYWAPQPSQSPSMADHCGAFGYPRIARLCLWKATYYVWCPSISNNKPRKITIDWKGRTAKGRLQKGIYRLESYKMIQNALLNKPSAPSVPGGRIHVGPIPAQKCMKSKCFNPFPFHILLWKCLKFNWILIKFLGLPYKQKSLVRLLKVCDLAGEILSRLVWLQKHRLRRQCNHTLRKTCRPKRTYLVKKVGFMERKRIVNSK